MKSEGEKHIILKCGPWRKTREKEKNTTMQRDYHRTRNRRTVECVWSMNSLPPLPPLPFAIAGAAVDSRSKFSAHSFIFSACNLCCLRFLLRIHFFVSFAHSNIRGSRVVIGSCRRGNPTPPRVTAAVTRRQTRMHQPVQSGDRAPPQGHLPQQPGTATGSATGADAGYAWA